MKSNLLADQDGFSLVQVLVSLGVASVLGAAVTGMIGQSFKSVSAVSNKVDENILVSDIASIFSDKNLCKAAVTAPGQQAVPSSGVFKLMLQLPGYGLVKEGVTLQSNLIVKEFYVDSLTAPEGTGVTGESKITGSLKIQTENVGATAQKSIQRKTRSAGIYTFYFNTSSRTVTGCFGVATMPPDEMCKSLGLIWDTAKKKCGQSAEQSCQEIGASWNGSQCVVNTISILGKSCGSGYALSGFSQSGSPICVSLPTQVASNTSSSNNSSSNSSNSSTTVVSNPSPPPPPPPQSQVGVSLNTWSNGGLVSTNISNATPGATVTFKRYINGSLFSSGTLGVVGSNGSFSVSSPVSCDSKPPPCSTKYEICAGGKCNSASGTVPK